MGKVFLLNELMPEEEIDGVNVKGTERSVYKALSPKIG